MGLGIALGAPPVNSQQTEAPNTVVFDELFATTVTASAYAPTPAFSNLNQGLAGIDIAINGVYAPWHAPGYVWTAKTYIPNLPNGAQLMPGAAVAVGGIVYVFGGLTNSAATGLTWAYDPASGSWTARSPMPTPRYKFAAAEIDGKIYAVGGTDIFHSVAYNVLEVYDPIADSWTTRAPMPTGRFGLAAAATGGKLYAIGGTGFGPDLSVNEVYDSATDSWSTATAMPTARENLAAAALHGKIYALGGYTYAVFPTPPALSNNEEYDPATNLWNVKKPLPTARYNLATAVVGDKLYAIDGSTQDARTGGADVQNANEEYDPAADTWTARAPDPRPKALPAAASAGGRIYVLGPLDSSRNFFSHDEYDPGVATKFQGLIPNTLYNFKARSRNAAGVVSPETPIVSTYTLAALPVVLPYSAAAINSLQANWGANSNPGGTGYSAVISSGPSPNTNGFSGNVTIATTSTFAQFSGLSLNAVYYVDVQASNFAGHLTRFTGLGSRSTLAAPPINTSAVTVTSSTVSLAWSANGNPAPTQFEISYSSVDAFSTGASISTAPWVTATTATIQGLLSAATYYFRVRAFNRDSVPSAFDAIVSTMTIPFPAAPTLQARGISPNSIEWRWLSVANAAGYRVESSTGGSLSGDLAAGTTVWLEAGLIANSSYTHAVAAFNANGVSTSPYLTRYSLSAVPQGTSVVGMSPRTVSLAWGANTNPPGTAYVVAYSSVDAFVTQAAVLAVAPMTGTSLTVNGLSTATTYYFHVQALNGDGVASAFDQTVSAFTYPIPSPVNPSAAAASPSAIIWSWNAVAYATGYRVLSSTGANLSGDLSSATTFWLETGLLPNTSYYRQIVAFTPSGVSTPTAVTRFTLANAPVATAVVAVASTTVSLAWGGNSNPASTLFQISYSSADAFLTGPPISTAPLTAATALTIRGLQSGSTYFFRVRALNGDSLPSPFDLTTSTLTVPFPAAPLPVGQATTTTSIAWSWGPVTNAAGYRVISAAGVNLSGDLPAATTSWTENGLSPNSSYARQVAAFNINGASTSSIINRFTLAAGPAGTIVTGVSAFTASLGWSDLVNPPGTQYQVLYSSVDSFVTSTAISTSAPVSNPLGTVTSLIPATTYYFKVQALNGDGIGSAFDNTVSTVTLPPPPPPSSFSPSVIDSGANAYSPAVAIDATGLIHAAYIDGVSGNLLYRNAIVGSNWSGPATVVDVAAAGNSLGSYTGLSLALGVDGAVHLAYFSNTPPCQGLCYAKLSGGAWTRQPIDNDTDDFFTSAALDGAGNLHVAYTSSGGSLKYGRFNGIAWSTQTVDAASAVNIPSTDQAYIKELSLALDGAGNPRIAYFDSSTSQLFYRAFSGSGWLPREVVVDNVSGNPTFNSLTGVSLALNGAGAPKISYTDDFNTGNVYYAEKTNGSWTLSQAVTNAGGAAPYAVLSTSLILDGNGNPNIAFFENFAVVAAFAWRNGVAWSTQTVDSTNGASMLSMAMDASASPHLVYSDPLDLLSAPLKYASATAMGFSPPMGGGPGGKVHAPSNLVATSVGNTSITWAWASHSTNESGFRLYGGATSTGPFVMIADIDKIGRGQTTFSESGLVPNTTYFRYVAAVNAGGVVTSSGIYVVTVQAVALSSPALSAQALSTSSLRWSWNSVANATGYRVLSSTDGSLSGDLSANTTNWTESNLSPNTSYARKVAAFTSTAIATSTLTSAYTLAAVPGVPGTVFTAVSSMALTTNWLAGTLAGGFNPIGTSYLVQISTVSNFGPIFGSSQTNNLNASFGSLFANTTYYAQVQAINGSGSATAFASLGFINTTPPAFGAPQVSTDGLNWQVSSAVLERSTNVWARSTVQDTLSGINTSTDTYSARYTTNGGTTWTLLTASSLTLTATGGPTAPFVIGVSSLTLAHSLTLNDLEFSVQNLAGVAGKTTFTVKTEEQVQSTVTIAGNPEMIFSAPVSPTAQIVSTNTSPGTVALQAATTQGLTLVSNLYSLGPDSTTYSPPGWVTFYYDPARLSSLGISTSTLGIYDYNVAQGTWVLLGGTVNIANGSITVPVSFLASILAVLADTTPPTIAATRAPQPNAKGWSNTDVAVSFTCSDLGSGLAGPCPSPVVVTNDGINQVSRQIRDRAGNIGSVTVTLDIDKTAPVTSVAFGSPLYTAPAGGLFVTTVTPVSLTAIDPIINGAASGIGSTSYRIDQATFSIYASTFSLIEGARQIAYFSADNAGNVEVIRTTTVFVDATPPTSVVTIGAPSYTAADGTIYVATTTPLTFSAADPALPQLSSATVAAGSGVNHLEIAVDTSVFSVYGGSVTLAEGRHVILYRAVDNVGNVEAAHALSVQSDATPPVSSLVIGQPQFAMSTSTLLVSSRTPFGIVAMDPVINSVASGVKDTWYGVADIVASTTTFLQFSASFTLSGLDVVKVIGFYSRDNVLNTEVVKSSTVLLDSTPPEVSLLSPAGCDSGICRVLKGRFPVLGTARDLHFASYVLDAAPGQNAAAGFAQINSGAVAVSSGTLGVWDTGKLSGWQTLRLTATDLVQNVSVLTLNVWVGDPAALMVLGNHDTFNMPTGVAVSSSGAIYVADREADRVQVFSSTGGLLATFGGHPRDGDDHAVSTSTLRLHEPAGVAVDAAGDVFIADTDDNRVLELSPSGQVLLELGRKKARQDDDHGSAEREEGRGTGEFHEPLGVAVDEAGAIYVADSDNRRVQVFSSSGAFVLQFALPPLPQPQGDDDSRDRDGDDGPALGKPAGIALDASGKIYVADPPGRRALVYSSTGTLLLTIPIVGDKPGRPGKPYGVAVSPSGNCLLVSDQKLDRVLKFDFQGAQNLSFGQKAQGDDDSRAPSSAIVFRKPAGLALDAAGNLYVADRNNESVKVFSLPNGRATVVVPAPKPDDGLAARDVIDRDDGGKVQRKDKTSVAVPPQALAQDLKITVAPPAAGSSDDNRRRKAQEDGQLKVASPPVEFSPEGTKFATPATLTIPYDPQLVAEQGVSEGDLKINYWNRDKQQWEAFDSTVDRANHTVTAKTSHFSLYQVLSSTPGVGVAAGPAADPTFMARAVYAFPNPAVRGAKPTIHVAVGVADEVKITILNVAGQEVAHGEMYGTPPVVDDGGGPQYAYEWVWDGHIASGMYFYTVEASKAGYPKIRRAGKLGIVR